MTNNNTIKIKPAFIVVDLQNCFAAPGGSYHKMKFDIQRYRRVIEPLKNAVSRARRFGIPVFFTKATREPSGIDNLDRVHKILPAKRKERIKKMPLCVRGTWDSNLVKELRINSKKDHIVEKRRDSAFYGTELQVWLEALGVDTLIFSGIDTSICVESSLRDAFNIGYDVILLSDATASSRPVFQRTTIEEIKESFGLVMTIEEFFSALKKTKEGLVLAV